MPINVYFNFNGDYKKADEYYADVFGLGNPEIMKFGEMSEDPNFVVPDDMKDLVIHALLKSMAVRLGSQIRCQMHL